MKKFVFKATALAIGALVGSAAFASVNLDTSTTTGTFAKELNFSSTAPGVAIAAGQTIATKLGFGVSGGQDRYVRVDLNGAKLATVAAGTNIVNSTLAFANSTVVQGGAVGDTYVIYQVTAAGAGHAASDALVITLPSLHVTNGNAANVGTTYALYETAVAAVNNAAGTSLYKNSGDLLKFASGLAWSLTTNTTTASVESSFKKFTTATTTGAAVPTASVLTSKVGSLSFTVAPGVLNTAGTQVQLEDLVQATTQAVFTGDFSAAGTLNTSTDGCATVGAALTLNAAKTSANFALPVTGAAAYSRDLCYVVNGTTAVAAQTINAALDLTPATAANSLDVPAAPIGSITRDGTELQAPFATIHPDYLARVVLTSQHSADATVEASVITEDGVSCPAVNGAYVIKAGKQLFIDVNKICPALSTGTRLAVKLVIAAPNNTISGVFNNMNYNRTTGATDSLTSYPLLRPGTN
ncbi:hypothetical protein [Roseateles violae]|uniref:Uncharacterized protein n=1 Tax=Roseateles violae TaxID=3058042 RepID=A0ABT8DVQ6_9BURK|nr:hypothetical protein [Pelomonas sp. PFR6]MDN3920974.1 hypothetical protein [Pelomonas sp. PFR6]